MGRHGQPLWKPPTRKKRVWVTIEHPDGTDDVVLWTGYRVAAIRAAAKKAYPDCKILFGNWW